MILVVALIVLGPDKLPSAARRVGAMWSEFKRWRTHLETEVRSAFPDLPSTTEIARAVRSPITMLDRLADEHGATSGAGPGSVAGSGSVAGAGPGSFAGAGPGNAASATTTQGLASRVELSADDPALVGSPLHVPPQDHLPRVDATADPDVSLMN
jgi:Sec-independent protein translocase protein TatA